MIDAELLAKAYKKLKSSVYFDKTQLILRDKIVNFENEIKKLEEYFCEFANEINDEVKFGKLVNEIIQSISILSFPKKLRKDSSNANIIINDSSKNLEVEELQHFIDMDVRGHILGVLWVMMIGYRIDKAIYKHSYGNRIRKSLYNELSKKPTYSPYLFEPYFEQYESWRDTAMEEAVKHLKLKQDVIIMTMDFKRYYYSVDMNKEAFDKIYDDAFQDDDEKRENTINKKMNEFVCSVVMRYSELFDAKKYNNRKILPIGFLPSNVIANWFLNNFDKSIINGWNPIYYGRYVDDILIVDKVEQHSDIYEKAKKNKLTSDDVVEYFLMRCSKWNRLDEKSCCIESNKNGLLIIDDNTDEKDKIYQVNPKYSATINDSSKIIVQNDKVKIFYFKSSETDALITCFRKNIAKNKSEFRRMPEDETVFQDDDYSEIYHLQTNESPNKFRGIEGISVDKYELSKFIGKHLRIGGMIEDVIESKFEKDIYSIFNQRVTIENYISWEKVIEIFVINERFDTAKKFIFNIMKSIDALTYNEEDGTSCIEEIKKSLYLHLYSSVNRTFALVWKKECTDALTDIYRKFSDNNICNSNNYNTERYKYCKTRMIDKYVMPLSIDMLETEKVYSPNANINLTHFYDILEITRSKFECKYIFYPYLMTMYDFSIISAIEQFHCTMESSLPTPFKELKGICDHQKENYILCNYNTEIENTSIENPVYINAIESIRKNVYEVSVGNTKKDRLSVAIANVKLDHVNFERLIKGIPNRSYGRYRDISTIVNDAIDKKADMLIMPESFVPFEWLPTLARTCTKNNLAIVTGVEHVYFKGKIFNLTAVLLPYREEKYRCVHISFHLKTHYAPSEKSEIHGYRLHEVEGENYELYKWNDCYFPVYCCYELTSINDRALFQSYADFLIAIEWNRDINYYSNILESLSRDIHCYCIQVNSSDYGDSRITKPSKTEEKDMIRTKGGKNSTILVDTIDISKLRNFQIKEYELQRQDAHFKTTSPDFNVKIVMKKVRGEDLK